MDKDNMNACSGSCDGGCGCGCGDEQDTIVLTLEDNTEMECQIIGVFEALDKEYIALLPSNDDIVLIYQYIEGADGQVDLKLIEDDVEFNEVSEIFHDLFEDDDEEEE